MKFAVEFPVESTIRIGAETIAVTKEGKEYGFVPSEDGRLTAIRITIKVDPNKFSSTIQPTSGLAKAKVTIRADNAIVDELRADLQAIESTFSFLTGALKRVLWSREKLLYFPENEAERSSAHIPTFDSSTSYREEWIDLDEGKLANLLDAKARYLPLKVPMAWLREGLNDFERLRYVEAFNDFYFVVEDFYSGGKTAQKEVLKQMKASAELKQTAGWAADAAKNSGRLLPRLEAMLNTEGLQLDANGLIELLVKTRGRTHHYTSKASGRYPDPFEQASYESIAWVAMGVAAKAIDCRVRALDKGSSSNAADSG
jgi:hypothetical protein